MHQIYKVNYQNIFFYPAISLGKIDGKFQVYTKIHKALNQYFAERQINTDTKITTIFSSIRKMQAELGELEQKSILSKVKIVPKNFFEQIGDLWKSKFLKQIVV